MILWIQQFLNKSFYFFFLILLSFGTGICVKAYTLIDNEKCFVNICQSEGIPPPEDISVDQLTEILSSETPSTYKIPMSITELRKTDDKSGKEATVCDVAINPQFYRKIIGNIVFRDFLITIIFEAFDNKYNIQINRDTWVILKNRKFIGTLVKHRVQNRDVKQVYQSYQNPTKEHKGLIEALDNSFEAKPKTKSRSLIQEIRKGSTPVTTPTSPTTPVVDVVRNLPSVLGQRIPDYRLFKRSEPTTHLIGEFYLPEIQSQKDIKLNIGANRVVLETNGYSFDKFTNYTVEPTKCIAQFNQLNHVRITIIVFKLTTLICYFLLFCSFLSFHTDSSDQNAD